MELLNKTKCYLTGHMQYQNGESWRNIVKERLGKLGVTSFDPYHKPFINSFEENDGTRAKLLNQMENEEYDVVTKYMKQVRCEDLRLCDISDFIFCRISPSIASWGTAEEIFWSNRMKKPIFLVVEGGKKKCPLWLVGVIPHKYIYDTIEDALVMLEKIHIGEKEINSDRWHLLKDNYR